MEIRFSKDYKHNYLIICDNRVLMDDYQLKMMTQNPIDGLLSCQERMINGDGLLYYDVTSKQSLKNMFEIKTINIEELRKLFFQLEEVLINLQKYILESRGLILDPQYIFYDIDKEKYYFLLYPYYDGDDYKLEVLLRFLTEKVNPDDIKALEAVYQMMDVSLRQGFETEEVLKWFRNEFEEVSENDYSKGYNPDNTYSDNLYSENHMNEHKNIREDGADTRNQKEDAFRTFFEEEDKKEKISIWKKFIAWIRGYDEEEEDSFSIEEMEYNYEENNAKAIEKDRKSDETVFIPWIENSEQKLYGLGRNKYHIDLNRVPITVGKMEGAVDMVISDNSVSRIHAKFLRTGNKYAMQDMNSTNGCFKNGVRLLPNQQVMIEPGDEVGIGKLKFIYR